jgi:hypothetical protein
LININIKATFQINFAELNHWHKWRSWLKCNCVQWRPAVPFLLKCSNGLWNINGFQYFTTVEGLTRNQSEFWIGLKCQRRQGRTFVKAQRSKNFDRRWKTNGCQCTTFEEHGTFNQSKFRIGLKCHRR